MPLQATGHLRIKKMYFLSSHSRAVGWRKTGLNGDGIATRWPAAIYDRFLQREAIALYESLGFEHTPIHALGCMGHVDCEAWMPREL